MVESKPIYDRILESAAALIAEHGYAETSMDRIAERAGVAKGSIFYHFKNKDGLLVALVEEGFRVIYKAVEKPLPGCQRPVEQLAALIRKHFGMYIEYHNLARIIFSTTKYGVSSVAASRIDAAQRQYRDYVASLIQRGIDAGELRPVQPWFAASVLMSQLGGAAEAWLHQPEQCITRDEAIEQALQMTLYGVCLNPPAPT